MMGSCGRLAVGDWWSNDDDDEVAPFHILKNTDSLVALKDPGKIRSKSKICGARCASDDLRVSLAS